MKPEKMLMSLNSWVQLVNIVNNSLPFERKHTPKCRTCPLAALCVTENYEVILMHCESCGRNTLCLVTDLIGVPNIQTTKDSLVACVAECDFVHRFTRTCVNCQTGTLLEKLKGTVW